MGTLIFAVGGAAAGIGLAKPIFDIPGQDHTIHVNQAHNQGLQKQIDHLQGDVNAIQVVLEDGTLRHLGNSSLAQSSLGAKQIADQQEITSLVARESHHTSILKPNLEGYAGMVVGALAGVALVRTANTVLPSLWSRWKNRNEVQSESSNVFDSLQDALPEDKSKVFNTYFLGDGIVANVGYPLDSQGPAVSLSLYDEKNSTQALLWVRPEEAIVDDGKTDEERPPKILDTSELQAVAGAIARSNSIDITKLQSPEVVDIRGISLGVISHEGVDIESIRELVAECAKMGEAEQLRVGH